MRLRTSVRAGRSPLPWLRIAGACLVAASAACADSDAATEHDGDMSPGGGASAQAESAPFEIPGLSAVWGSAANDVWAVGEAGAILHYDGTSWSDSPSNVTQPLLGVHGTGPNDVWAVGEEIVLHWDGSTWSTILDQVNEALLAVWTGAPDDVWVAGIDRSTHLGVMRHWDGQGFVRGVFGTVTSVWELWGSGTDDVWVAGASVDGSGFVGRGNIDGVSSAHYSGAALRGVWGQDANDVWLAPYQGPFQHWDGTEFTTVDGLEDTQLLGISGSGPDDIWSVGLHGTVLHWDGSAWSRSSSPTDATLWAVWAAQPDDAWAVGGVLMHWNGTEWRQVGVHPGRTAVNTTH